MKFIHLAFVSVSAVALSGCGNLMSIYRDDSLLTPGGHIVTMDAKQRAIISNRTRATSDVYRRYCSEPAPDALTALSLGASGELNAAALNSGNPDIRLRAALSASEAAATIERTQTINVLREMMFRTCERYLNGSIGDDELIIQAARDQRTIVSVLAIEQLTRTARPASTVLISGSSSATYSDPKTGYDNLIAAQADAEEADTELKAAELVFTGLSTTTPPCTDPLPTNPGKADDTAEQKTYAECKASVEALRAAKVLQARAAGNVAFFKGIAERPITGIASQSGLGAQYAAGGGISGAPSDATIEKVATTVKEIVEQAYKFDEVEMTCVARLRRIALATTAVNLGGTNTTSSVKGAPGNAKVLSFAANTTFTEGSFDAACLNYLMNKRPSSSDGS